MNDLKNKIDRLIREAATSTFGHGLASPEQLQRLAREVRQEMSCLSDAEFLAQTAREISALAKDADDAIRAELLAMAEDMARKASGERDN